MKRIIFSLVMILFLSGSAFAADWSYQITNIDYDATNIYIRYYIIDDKGEAENEKRTIFFPATKETTADTIKAAIIGKVQEEIAKDDVEKELYSSVKTTVDSLNAIKMQTISVIKKAK